MSKLDEKHFCEESKSATPEMMEIQNNASSGEDALSMEEKVLLEDLRQLVEKARCSVAQFVNSELTLMYWRVGERINREILKYERAEYQKDCIGGRQLVAVAFRSKGI